MSWFEYKLICCSDGCSVELGVISLPQDDILPEDSRLQGFMCEECNFKKRESMKPGVNVRSGSDEPTIEDAPKQKKQKKNKA